jgi:isopentenyl-diphosphate Delta-isomerase
MDNHITIPAFDASGRLYPIEKLEAHRSGVLHLAISVFIFAEGRLLIQQRAAGKYHSGGLWANTCCTHPDWGEDLETAAHRRLREELGFDVPTLDARSVIEYRVRVSDDLWEHERVQVFRYVSNVPIEVPPPLKSEVARTRWIRLPELRFWMRRRPEIFAPWFRIYLDRWDELDLTPLSRQRGLDLHRV